MAQTLNATLAAAMDSINRQPLVEVVSDKFVADIPLVGQRLTSDQSYLGSVQNERNPEMLILSDGRLVVVHAFYLGATNASHIRLMVSDTSRTQFTSYSVSITGQELAIVELANGNIGLIAQDVSNLRAWSIVPTTGVATLLTGSPFVTNALYWLDTSKRGGVSVIRRADGTYMCAYVEGNMGYTGGGGSWEDSTNTIVRYKTSADFITWSAAVTISMPGLNVTHNKYNPFLFQDTDDQLSVLFAYAQDVVGTAERVNIYQYTSDDNGATWVPASGAGTFGDITTYPDFGTIAQHPVAAPSGGGSFTIAYHEQRAALHANADMLNWDVGLDTVDRVFFDPVSRKAYATVNDGNKFYGIVVIDVDTWTITKTIDATTTPALNSFWTAGAPDNDMGWSKAHADGDFIAIMSPDTTHARHIALYNVATDTITEYHFENIPAYGIVANTTPAVQGSVGVLTVDLRLVRIWVDAAAMRVYTLWGYPYAYGGVMAVGYLDLTETGPAFTHAMVFTDSGGAAPIEEQMIGMMSDTGDFRVYADMIIVTGGYSSAVSDYGGFTRTYTIGGALIHHFDGIDNPAYPYRGIKKMVRVGNVLYGTFLYESLYGNADRRGLAAINLSDNTVTYFRPTVGGEVDDYTFAEITSNVAGTELFITSALGVFVFTIATGTWELFDNTTYPGMFADPVNMETSGIAYDETNQQIFVGQYTGVSQGVTMFNRNGFMYQPQYFTATHSIGGWSYGSADALTIGHYEYAAALAQSDVFNTGLYVVWTNRNGTVTTIRWDTDAPEFNLSDYLLGGSNVTIKRSIDGTPHTLEFTVTHGHLFDPHNTQSLWSGILQKYRRVTVRFGERVAGVDYWHPAGTFVITGNKLSYSRGKYPTMHVQCEDMRTWWGDAEIIATDHYDSYPETVLEDLLTTFAGMTGAEIDLPVFANRYEISFQWLDTSIKKIVDTLCNRFGYFPTITVDNKFTARLISNLNAIDHTYPDITKIVSYTPDDQFSDYTNQVIVAGETRDFMEVMYAEEPVGQGQMGTVGWWGGHKHMTVWYSDDHTKKARYPRLEVLQSVSAGTFQLGGGSESITAVSLLETSCEITIDCPDLLPVLIGVLAAMIITGFACGWTYVVSGPCFWGFTFELAILFYVIASFASFQYQIHARPFGLQRLGCSAQADDFELQHLLGRVNSKKLDDPLAISAEQCQQIADHELMIVMMQRRRVMFEKVAHLQDEEGDTISIPHPFTGIPMTIFATDITRQFKVPSTTGEYDDGGFIDIITGWKAT